MSELAIMFCIVSTCLWFLTSLVLFVVLIAVYRRDQAHAGAVVQFTSLMVLMIKVLRLHCAMLIRYERNIAVWYNAATGERWMIDEASRNEFVKILKQIEAQLRVVTSMGITPEEKKPETEEAAG